MDEILDVGDDEENVGQCEENSHGSQESGDDTDSDVVEIIYQQPPENCLDSNLENPDESASDKDEYDNQVDFDDVNVVPKSTVEPESVGVPPACNGPPTQANDVVSDSAKVQLMKLKRVVTLQKQENEHLQSRLESCEREVSMLRVHNRTKQQRIVQAQKSLAQLQEELYMTREKYEARASALENSYRQLCKDVSSTEDALLQARLQLHQLQQRNKLLEDLNNEHSRTIEHLKMHLVQMQVGNDVDNDVGDEFGEGGSGMDDGGGFGEYNQGSALNPQEGATSARDGASSIRGEDFQGEASKIGSARTYKETLETSGADLCEANDNYNDDPYRHPPPPQVNLKQQLRMAQEHINALIVELADAIAKSEQSPSDSSQTRENWALLICKCKRTQIQNDNLRAQVNNFKRILKTRRDVEIELQRCKEELQARDRRAATELQQQAQAYESRINNLLHQLQQAHINESYARDQFHRVQGQVELLKAQVQMQQETIDTHKHLIASTNVQLQEALAQVESQQCTINELQQAKQFLEVNNIATTTNFACNANTTSNNAARNIDVSVANGNFNTL